MFERWEMMVELARATKDSKTKGNKGGNPELSFAEAMKDFERMGKAAKNDKTKS